MSRIEDLRGQFEEKYSTELWCLRSIAPDVPFNGLDREIAALYWLQETSQNTRRASVARLYIATPDQRIGMRVKIREEKIQAQKTAEQLPF